MGYLVTHIAACLVFAQLLGLLLGWLLWGYVARQRGVELQSLRERLADLNLSTRRMAFAGEQRVSLEAAPESIARPALSSESPATESQEAKPAIRKPLVEDDLLSAGSAPGRFFMLEDQTEDPAEEEDEPVEHFEEPAAKAPPIAPDLEAEVREARLQHFEQQVRELEGLRDRLPLLQADLSEAIAGRRAAESKVEEAKSHYEVRVSNLLSQIRDFERAAGEWDRIRTELERSEILKEKELSSVKSHLRDLQNNQMPQKAEPPAPAGMSPREIADLRERYQKAVTERDAIAAELETCKQSDGNAYGNSIRLTARVAELEEMLSTKGAHLDEQLARTESLLWRVAELEPFALAAPGLDENLRRLESEIAGHVAMHSESSDHIRSLLNRVGELETETTRAADLQNELAEREAAIVRLLQEHADKLDWKDREIAQHIAAREEQAEEMKRRLTENDAEIQKWQATHAETQHELQGWKDQTHQLEPLLSRIPALQDSLKGKDLQIGELLQTSADTFIELESWRNHALELEPLNDRVSALEQLASAKDSEIQALLTAHADTQRELQNSQDRIAQLAQLESRVPELEQTANAKDAELQSLLSAHANTQQDLRQSQERIARLTQLENRVPELEQSLGAHAAEIEQLKTSHTDKDGQLTFLNERLAALSDRLSALQQRLAELEPLAAKVPETEQKLVRQQEESRIQVKAIEERHRTELTRQKVNSAQRMRRLRQSLTNL